MSEVQAEPVVLEAGRYKLWEQPDGGWVVARATGTCESCQSCGCGEQAEPIHVPGMVIKMAASGKAAAMFGRMMGRKGGGDG